VWGEMLKDFWRQNSGSAGVMQLPRGGCHSSTGTCKVSYDAVVASSEDTDVFVLLLVFSSSIDARFFQKCGTQTRTRLIDISKLVATIGEDVCQALVGLHSFT